MPCTDLKEIFKSLNNFLTRKEVFNMKRLKKPVLILLGLFAVAALAVSLSGKITGNAVSSACSDSDGGRVYDVKGTTTSKIGSFTDLCKDSRTLLENYCRDGKRVTETIPCRYGCSEGACGSLLKTA